MEVQSLVVVFAASGATTISVVVGAGAGAIALGPPATGSPTRRASPVRPAKRGRCPKGTKRNKRTQNCDPKNRRGSPARPASPPRPASAKRGRCPNGTRRNKRTQNCEQK